VVAEALGRALAPVPFSSSIGLAAELLMAAGSPAQKARWLPALASGQQIGTLALAEGPGLALPPGPVGALATRAQAGRISGSKWPVADGGCAHFAVVVAVDGAPGSTTAPDAGLSLYLVDLSSAGVSRTPLASVDPCRKQARIDFNSAEAEPLGTPGQGQAVLQQVMNRAAVLMAFEQLGGADQALATACAYAQERFAFGRPIGSLQAIKHMLADMYVSATLARSNAYYGAWALGSNSAELPLAAATARVSATQAYLHCARNNIQVHGGMGFTWEFDCHLHYRRAQGLALALGPLSQWENLLVDQLVAQRAAQNAQKAA
jgi:alkylation response protein AidB-like acyl-CoA dehydrogenase